MRKAVVIETAVAGLKKKTIEPRRQTRELKRIERFCRQTNEKNDKNYQKNYQNCMCEQKKISKKLDESKKSESCNDLTNKTRKSKISYDKRKQTQKDDRDERRRLRKLHKIKIYIAKYNELQERKNDPTKNVDEAKFSDLPKLDEIEKYNSKQIDESIEKVLEELNNSYFFMDPGIKLHF